MIVKVADTHIADHLGLLETTFHLEASVLAATRVQSIIANASTSCPGQISQLVMGSKYMLVAVHLQRPQNLQ